MAKRTLQHEPVFHTRLSTTNTPAAVARSVQEIRRQLTKQLVIQQLELGTLLNVMILIWLSHTVFVEHTFPFSAFINHVGRFILGYLGGALLLWRYGAIIAQVILVTTGSLAVLNGIYLTDEPSIFL